MCDVWLHNTEGLPEAAPFGRFRVVGSQYPYWVYKPTVKHRIAHSPLFISTAA